MNDATVKRLNAINREFYATTAASFDRSRSRPWPGWEPLVPLLDPPLRVLDVGCGNGRFGVFLAGHLGADQIAYTGIDSNPVLLARARETLAGIDARIEQHDVIEQPLRTVINDAVYDLVALFGVLHHIPGMQQRLDLMRQLAAYVAPGGYFAFAAWRFYEFERFRDRIVPWPDDIATERHDYLLDWRRDQHALRYCHYVDDAEHAALVAATGLSEVMTYRADGHTNTMNRYSILKRAPA